MGKVHFWSDSKAYLYQGSQVITKAVIRASGEEVTVIESSAAFCIVRHEDGTEVSLPIHEIKFLYFQQSPGGKRYPYKEK